MITQITDHIVRAKQLLPEQFKNKPNIENRLTLFAGKIQELETVFFQLLNERLLANAVGQQLDNLGTILGELRAGRNDAGYKAALAVKIKINVSSGTPETSISVMAALTNATNVLYVPFYAAAFELRSNGGVIPLNLIENILLIAPAGVAVSITVYGAVTNPFTFDQPGSGLDQGEFVFGA